MLYTRRDPYMCRAVRKERAPRLNSERLTESSLAAFRRVDLFSLPDLTAQALPPPSFPPSLPSFLLPLSPSTPTHPHSRDRLESRPLLDAHAPIPPDWCAPFPVRRSSSASSLPLLSLSVNVLTCLPPIVIFIIIIIIIYCHLT